MPEARACHLQNSTAFFCIGIDRHSTDIIISNITKQGGRL